MASGQRFWAVIPAAGSSRRFAECGYTTPKPLLTVRSKSGVVCTMLEHVLRSLPDGLATRVGLPPGVPVNGGLDIGVWRIENTIGQADTVRQLIQGISPDDGVVVLDCDTILQKGDVGYVVRQIATGYAASVLVTESDDPNMSRVDQVPRPTVFVEKQMISRYGMIGVRAFGHAGKLHKVLEQIVVEHEHALSEPYLSTALNRYSGDKWAHFTKDWQDWGTPERLVASGATILDSKREAAE